jgi:hypothetical protein
MVAVFKFTENESALCKSLFSLASVFSLSAIIRMPSLFLSIHTEQGHVHERERVHTPAYYLMDTAQIRAVCRASKEIFCSLSKEKHKSWSATWKSFSICRTKRGRLKICISSQMRGIVLHFQGARVFTFHALDIELDVFHFLKWVF